MQSYSQFGEDKIILEFFNSLSIAKGFFLEIGANHPTHLSQTWLLEQNGWSGILVEPLPHLAEMLAQKRKNSLVFEAAVSSQDKTGHSFLIVKDHDAESVLVFDKPTDNHPYKLVRVRTINDILAEAGCTHIDFLSIDIEGMEIPALQDFDFARYRPKLILIEDHCHDLNKHKFLQSKGYKVVNRCGCNNWYIPQEARYTGRRTISRYELARKIYLGLPFRMIKQRMKSKGWIA